MFVFAKRSMQNILLKWSISIYLLQLNCRPSWTLNRTSFAFPGPPNCSGSLKNYVDLYHKLEDGEGKLFVNTGCRPTCWRSTFHTTRMSSMSKMPKNTSEEDTMVVVIYYPSGTFDSVVQGLHCVDWFLPISFWIRPTAKLFTEGLGITFWPPPPLPPDFIGIGY
jgi:hypothetical protein